MNPSKKSASPIDAYLAKLPLPVQKQMQKLRQAIHEAAPEAKEAMSYGAPAFQQGGNLILFAAFKNHIGIYPTPSAIEAFKKELSGYETSKGTVKFPLDKPIPFELVKRIVRFRVKESASKK
jgi:uncharacterized protein YdhG (YjbR/CyaY superfamily)